MRAIAQTYHAMASIIESWLDVSGGEEMRKAVERSLSEFQSARDYLENALNLLPELVVFLQSHWDEEYEGLLRTSGFKGSLFILRDYKVHLQDIQQGLDTHVAALQAEIPKLSTAGRAVSPLDRVLELSTRALCQAAMRFLAFDDQVSQTQLVHLSRVASANAVSSQQQTPGP